MIYKLSIIFCLLGFSYCLLNIQTFRPTLTELLNPDVYPERSVYGIKSIQTDYWKLEDIYGNGAGGVAVNYPWVNYQPVKKLSPCTSNEEEYEGYCFVIDQVLDSYTKQYTDNSLTITGILIMVPEWARQKNVNCKIANKYFCSPDDGADFARFAGFLARRYNGRNGNGRIVDFVIHNEVNSGDWFNVGCGNGVVCNADAWVDVYSSSYINAYDQIIKHQKNAKVLISLDHHFDYVFNQYLTANSPIMSGKTLIEKLVPKLGQRKWSLAYHSYPPSLLHVEFSKDDLPKITFGNLNVLVGWLMQTFPNTQSAWKVYLTENGINSISPYSNEDKQNSSLCQAFRNIINTPFIENFVYHRMKDHPDEVKDGLGCGLVDQNGRYKKAWSTWAMSNRFDVVGSLSCGFENLPFLILKRGYKAGYGHWTTTRDLPNGYVLEQKYKIYREIQPETRLLYECKINDSHNYVSVFANCENQFHLGPLGYVYIVQKPNTVPLYRCITQITGDHFISTDRFCENEKFEELLGYVFQG